MSSKKTPGKKRGQTRSMHVRVKTAKGRKLSSTLWLQRQLNDPYVTQAQTEGFRSRAAFKLKEIDDKFRFLKPGKRVVDLGCAPGGWCQIAADRVNSNNANKNYAKGFVVGIDLQEVDSIEGVTLLQGDFLDAQAEVLHALNGMTDIVLSDMAAPSSGHRATDHMRIITLCEAAAYFSFDVLTEGGVFVAKVLQGGTEHTLLALLKTRFAKVQHFKPPASRKDSAEMYVVAQNFRATAPLDTNQDNL